MMLLRLVGPALRLVAGGVNKLAGSADDSPKTSSILTVMGMLGGLVGLTPDSLASIGSMLPMQLTPPL